MGVNLRELKALRKSRSIPGAAGGAFKARVKGGGGLGETLRASNKSSMGDVLSQWKGRLGEAHGDGWDIASATLKHAARGAVGGAAIGGTMEWSKGGSFWTGAKSGAFNGAVGYAGYRTLKTATAATSRNPFGRNGAFGEAFNQMKPAVSNQVKAIRRNTQTARTAGSVMNGGARI